MAYKRSDLKARDEMDLEAAVEAFYARDEHVMDPDRDLIRMQRALDAAFGVKPDPHGIAEDWNSPEDTAFGVSDE
jgi:hypothetical protein